MEKKGLAENHENAVGLGKHTSKLHRGNILNYGIEIVMATAKASVVVTVPVVVQYPLRYQGQRNKERR